jgi:hypothetical protein
MTFPCTLVKGIHHGQHLRPQVSSRLSMLCNGTEAPCRIRCAFPHVNLKLSSAVFPSATKECRGHRAGQPTTDNEHSKGRCRCVTEVTHNLFCCICRLRLLCHA